MTWCRQKLSSVAFEHASISLQTFYMSTCILQNLIIKYYMAVCTTAWSWQIWKGKQDQHQILWPELSSVGADCIMTPGLLNMGLCVATETHTQATTLDSSEAYTAQHASQTTYVSPWARQQPFLMWFGKEIESSNSSSSRERTCCVYLCWASYWPIIRKASHPHGPHIMATSVAQRKYYHQRTLQTPCLTAQVHATNGCSRHRLSLESKLIWQILTWLLRRTLHTKISQI